MSGFKFVPRSAVYGDGESAPIPSRAQQARSMPAAMPFPGRAGNPHDAAHAAHPALVEVALLRGQLAQAKRALGNVAADRARIVKEANAKLGALVQRVQHLSGMRTAYAPGIQTPGQGQVDVGVPTHALRNPNLYTVDGARGAPPAVADPLRTGNPHDNAGNPHDTAHNAHETVRAAEDAIFYGSGDAAFYEGGEND